MVSNLDNQRADLQVEFAKWKLAGKRPRLFVRDDDAIEVTPALQCLTELVERYNAPLLLAVIPKFATPALGEFVDIHPLITPAVHGWEHKNHARAGNKKCEFDDQRSFLKMQKDIEAARQRLLELFGARLSPLFVPPWNRIGEKAIQATADVGFKAISGFGWKDRSPVQKWKNTHVDVVDWKAGRAGKSLLQLMTEIEVSLSIARENDFAPVGILLHHLVHDPELWHTIDLLFNNLTRLGARWIDVNQE